MKYIKLAADISLGLTVILFAYVYWFSYQVEQHGTSGMSGKEITDVTVNLFTVTLAISIISAILRYTEIRTQKVASKLSKALLLITLLPSLNVVIGYGIYWAS